MESQLRLVEKVAVRPEALRSLFFGHDSTYCFVPLIDSILSTMLFGRPQEALSNRVTAKNGPLLLTTY